MKMLNGAFNMIDSTITKTYSSNESISELISLLETWRDRHALTDNDSINFTAGVGGLFISTNTDGTTMGIVNDRMY